MAGYASSGSRPRPAVREVPIIKTTGSEEREAGSEVSEERGSADAVLDSAATRSSSLGTRRDDASPHASRIPSKHQDTLRMLIARNLTKEFDSGAHHLTVLRDVNFEIAQGEFIAVVGPSGSGKTTLLGLLAGLDTPTRGEVILDGTDITRLTEDARAKLRGEKVGFVFQTFQLIPTLTAVENVQVPLELRGERNAAARAIELLERVGLADRTDHLPTQLSGGEQQRVALARAFANRPRILFADEPTGNLDGTTGARIVALLEELNREAGSTIVLVTHDLTLAERARRMISLRDGVVVEDRRAGGNGATP